jgi:peptidoglycan hydrolase-like protein with peptidoglycan-binding domain
LNKAIGEALVEDGIYGPATRAGVVRIQTGHALAADGIVGPRTEVGLIQAALNQIVQASLVAVSGVLNVQTTQQIRRIAPSDPGAQAVRGRLLENSHDHGLMAGAR